MLGFPNHTGQSWSQNKPYKGMEWVVVGFFIFTKRDPLASVKHVIGLIMSVTVTVPPTPDILIINISELSMLSELQKLTQNYGTTIVRVSLWALQVLFIAKFVCVHGCNCWP